MPNTGRERWASTVSVAAAGGSAGQNAFVMPGMAQL